MVGPDPVANVELLRQQLEVSVAKLGAALRHWQTWEAEYEGLKEELQALPEDASEDELVKVGKIYEGDFVTDKEINELFNLEKKPVRSASQILGLLDRRLDYVQKNVSSLNKQLDAEQVKLDQVVIVSETELRNEEGLPVTDIYEELDEDGNVISGKATQPGNAEADIVRALEKAGLKGQDLAGRIEEKPAAGVVLEKNKSDTASSNVDPKQVHSPQGIPGPPPAAPEIAQEPFPVSSAKKAPLGTAMSENKPDVEPPSKKQVSAHLQDVAKHSFPSGERVVEVNSDDEDIDAIGPRPRIQESPQDAAFRARMLEYSMREVGEIVAQLDIEEGDLSDTDSGTAEWGEDGDEDDLDGLEDDDMDDHDASSVGDDDNHGLSRNGNLSEDYKREMQELEQRLNARMFENVGPNPDASLIAKNDEEHAPAATTTPTQPQPRPAAADLPERPAKKPKGSVRFAETLDISPAPEPSKPAPTAERTQPASTATAPIANSIIERAPAPLLPFTAAPTKKVSRFKASRQPPPPVPAPITPHRSAVQPLASTIIERPSSSTTSTTEAPDVETAEYDPLIQQQQVAREYYAQRNRLVQKQGGFARFGKEGEVEGGEVDDNDDVGEDEEGKRMSLFRRARVVGWEPPRR